MPDDEADLSSPSGSASPDPGMSAWRVLEPLSEAECMQLLANGGVGRLEAGGTLTVQVRDDGVGRAEASRGSGLTGLWGRVEAVGGRMTLDSPAGSGTVLTVLLPITADDH
jgi:signal transduction histidine kinase